MDTTFDTDGTALVSLGTTYYGKISVLLQSNDKIVVTGSASDPNVFNDTPVFVALRLNPNGVLDTTFGVNGKATALVNDNCFAYAGFLQQDGKILTAGLSFGAGGIYFSSMRYNDNGTIDATYGTNGSASTNLSFDYRIINSVVLQPDGKFLVALSQYNQPSDTYDFKVRRFNPEGTFDNDFGGFPGVTTSFFNGYDEAFSMGLQSDYKILVAGTTHNSITNDFAITRYTNTVLSVPGFNSSSDLVLYPNPVSSILNIKTSDDSEIEIMECCIYNMLGQMVYKNSGNETAIDARSFSTGIYSLQIKTTNGLINKKFIKE